MQDDPMMSVNRPSTSCQLPNTVLCLWFDFQADGAPLHSSNKSEAVAAYEMAAGERVRDAAWGPGNSSDLNVTENASLMVTKSGRNEANIQR